MGQELEAAGKAAAESVRAATDREAWLAERRTGIGSSDAAACVGLSPWATPYHVYCSKVFGVEQEDSPELAWGRRLEPVVAQAAEEAIGSPLVIPSGIIRRPDRVWQLASLDRTTQDGLPVEIKTSRSASGWGPGGTDAVPEAYFVQVTHQLIVSGRDLAYLAALIGGNDFRLYTIRLDKEMANKLTWAEMSLWDKVETRDPPTPDWSHPATPEIVKRMNVPTPDTTLHTSSDEARDLVGLYQMARKHVSEVEKQKAEIKAKIEHLMGTHSAMSLPDGTVIRRKAISRAGYTVKPTTYFDFRVLSKEAGDE